MSDKTQQVEEEQVVETVEEVVTEEVTAEESVVAQALADTLPADPVEEPDTTESVEEVVETAPPSAFDKVESLIGDVPDAETETGKRFLEAFNEGDASKLDPISRELIRAVLVQAKSQVAEKSTEFDAERVKLQEERTALAKERRELTRKQAQFESLFQDPAFQKAMRGPEGEAPKDPTSAEYIDYTIDKRIAERMGKALSPVAEHAGNAAREKAWDDLVEKYPELAKRDESDLYREAMGLYGADAKKGDARLTSEQYIQLALGNIARRKLEAEQRARAEQRRAGARKIQRSTTPGTGAKSHEIPEGLTKDPEALNAWLMEDPARMKHILATQGR